MIVVKFRSKSESEDILKKMKKMKKFITEVMDCFEEKLDDEHYRKYDDDEEDDDEEYRRDMRRPRRR